MLLAIFGVPTASAALGVRIAQSVMSCAVGPTDLVDCRSLDELRAVWGSRSGKSILYYNESPSGEIASFFKDAATPLLLLADDPVEVAISLHVERSVEVLQAIRVSSLCSVSISELSHAGDVQTIRASRHSSLPLRAFVDTIAAFYRFPIDRDFHQRVAADIAGWLGLQELPKLSEPWCALTVGRPINSGESLSAVEVDLIEGALGEYRGNAISRVAWPQSLFMTEENNALNGDPVDLTGPARLVIHGPYMGLPRGNWLARVRFECLQNLFGLDILIHVTGSAYMAKGRMSVSGDGIYETQISFCSDDPYSPNQVQLLLERGAICGGLRLISVAVERSNG
jgi:hypothetical protein